MGSSCTNMLGITFDQQRHYNERFHSDYIIVAFVAAKERSDGHGNK